MTTVSNPQVRTPRAELRRFSNSLPMLLLRAREAVMVEFRAMLRGQGLTEQQWRVLRALDASGSCEAAELARRTFLLAPSLSRILPELEKQKLISVKAHSADHRRKIVQLTATGRSLMQVVAPMSEGIYANITSRLGAQRLEQLEALLVDVERTLGTAAPNSDSQRGF